MGLANMLSGSEWSSTSCVLHAFNCCHMSPPPLQHYLEMMQGGGSMCGYPALNLHLPTRVFNGPHFNFQVCGAFSLLKTSYYLFC